MQLTQVLAFGVAFLGLAMAAPAPVAEPVAAPAPYAEPAPVPGGLLQEEEEALEGVNGPPTVIFRRLLGPPFRLTGW
ncbi:uncharacterized protein DFL_007769 [Arthrobotrys flagrans]|uniref:Uncharacterized protein n=1 Tax=Arthrobotrys flagrans TaxID=97331 RepID=A0A436ZX15_ARTFL|nr:hypothetical protein DFL_007769 [Arthrobotrys flagrans]